MTAGRHIEFVCRPMEHRCLQHELIHGKCPICGGEVRAEEVAERRHVATARYGWIPDLPDKRDAHYPRRLALHELPRMVDLRSLCSAVENQGELGSCTANALAGALEFLEKRDGMPVADLSRLFIYYNERDLEDSVEWDSGASLRDGIKALKRWGVCQESLWPYEVACFADRPSQAAFAEAAEHKITTYARLTSTADMRTCLAEGFPFSFGFTVYESFESPAVMRTGVVRMPEASERSLGGHAVLAVGYDDARQVFIVRNSWGPDWGDGGYFYMPYSYLADADLAADFWTIRRATGL